jgi:hypothetical protein
VPQNDAISLVERGDSIPRPLTREAGRSF